MTALMLFCLCNASNLLNFIDLIDASSYAASVWEGKGNCCKGWWRSRHLTAAEAEPAHGSDLYLL